MDLNDVNLATYTREVSGKVSDPGLREKLLREFSAAKTANERVRLFLDQRGGSAVKHHATKLGDIPDRR